MPTVETVVLPAPEMVRTFPPLVTPPVRVKVPASETILASAVSVIAPAKVLLPDVLLNAPFDETPVPAISKASAAVVILLEISRAEPAATVVLPDVEPKALALEI